LKTKIIAEIGINHNGSIDTCKKLINISSASGCDYVKIQKRTPSICVPEDQKTKMRSTPWGDMTYLEYKEKIEFNEEQIVELIDYAKSQNIKMFASVWDIPSADLMSKYVNIAKIPSAVITDRDLCVHSKKKFNTLIISTGMSTEKEIEDCIYSCDADVVMHTNSTYPCPVNEINLNYIKWLKKRWPTRQIGYSGHEYGLVSTFASVALGAEWVERHITLNHNMWGSDHLSSLEPAGLFKLVKGIRDVESSMSQPAASRILLDGEKIKRESLRKQKDIQSVNYLNNKIFIPKRYCIPELMQRFRNKIYEKTELCLINKYLNKKDNVLEIGSCLGITTLRLSRKCKHVISVEANPELKESLQKTMQENNIKNVDLVFGYISQTLDIVNFQTYNLIVAGSADRVDNGRNFAKTRRDYNLECIKLSSIKKYRKY